MEKEEGEMSDDNAMIVDDLEDPTPTSETISNRTVLYKSEKTGIVVEQLEKIDASKLEERAKRFGLNLCGNRLVSQTQIDELYANAGIESGNERHFRFDALHLNGVDGLTAKDIFEYLEDYKPVSLEKVDDVSCNVVCQDHITTALALLVHSREIRSEELNKMLAKKSNYHWREGMPHPKKDLILMRFATNGDKKFTKKNTENKYSHDYYDQSMDSASKNPWGDLCKSWGVYDQQETFQRKLPKIDYEEDVQEETNKTVHIKNKRLALRLGKRTNKTEDSGESSSDSEWKRKSKTPRMRMHADDIECKQNKKQQLEKPRDADGDAYAPLCIEVVNSQSNYTPRETTKLSDKFKKIHRGSTNSIDRTRVHSRLGVKVVPVEDVYSDDCSSDNSEHNIMSRVQKVTSSTNNTSVWSRLASQNSKDSSQSDLRQVLKSKQKKPVDKEKNPVDLRGRLGKSKKTNLRIEIDNNYAE